jgi:hypothetical protein
MGQETDAMMGHCTACSLEITPAAGPSILWAPGGAEEPRQSYHLGCWLHLQTTELPQAKERQARAALRRVA